MIAFAPGWFLWPSFCKRFPGSQLFRISENAIWGSPWQICHSSALRALWEARFAAELQKTRAQGVLGKFAIARLYGHFGSRGLQQNVVLGRHFKYFLIRTWWHFRQGAFCGLRFAGVSPGRNFAEFQKTRAKGLLGKFAIARFTCTLGAAVCSKMLC